jgi:hypothetical protein
MNKEEIIKMINENNFSKEFVKEVISIGFIGFENITDNTNLEMLAYDFKASFDVFPKLVPKDSFLPKTNKEKHNGISEFSREEAIEYLTEVESSYAFSQGKDFFYNVLKYGYVSFHLLTDEQLIAGIENYIEDYTIKIVDKRKLIMEMNFEFKF